MERNPSLFGHVKAFEKFRAEPYEDVGGWAIGYGAHLDADGNTVTGETNDIKEDQAVKMLARDLYARRQKLAGALPNWNRIPGNARQALLDVAMGRDDILDESRSGGLYRDLKAAGRDANKLLAAVKKH
jgi:GH24 family phage-related lysozyme (muramidase)